MISTISGLRWAALTSAFLLPAPAAAAAPAADPAPVEQVAIDILAVEGSGCPAGTVTISALPDNAGFQLHHTDYRAAAGRRNCHVELAVDAPAGFAYAIMHAGYRGELQVGPGASTALRPTFQFTGRAPLILQRHTFTGPLDGDWQVTDDVEPAARAFSSCEQLQNLHINTDLRAIAADPPAQPSWISLAHALFEFEWRRC